MVEVALTTFNRQAANVAHTFVVLPNAFVVNVVFNLCVVLSCTAALSIPNTLQWVGLHPLTVGLVYFFRVSVCPCTSSLHTLYTMPLVGSSIAGIMSLGVGSVRGLALLSITFRVSFTTCLRSVTHLLQAFLSMLLPVGFDTHKLMLMVRGVMTGKRGLLALTAISLKPTRLTSASVEGRNRQIPIAMGAVLSSIHASIIPRLGTMYVQNTH